MVKEQVPSTLSALIKQPLRRFLFYFLFFKVLSQVKLVIRPMYSNPPTHGARIVEKILADPKNLKEWEAELKMVSERIIKMRVALRAKLEEIQAPGNWEHITN